LALCAALCASVFNPARVAIVPSLVPPHRLASSNSLVYASDRVVEILGAVAGGMLVASVGDAAFFVDAMTFAVSGVLLAFVQPSAAESAARLPFQPRQLLANAVDGVRFLVRHELLFANTTVSLLAQLSVGVSNGLLPVLIFRRFAGGDSEIGAQQFGVAEAAIAVGAVGMGLVYARIARRKPKGRLLISGWLGYGAALIGVAAAPTFELLLAVLVIVGIMNVLFFVPNLTISQELTPPLMRGRVFGARISLLSLSWLPIVLFAGGLADLMDASLLIGAAGAFTILVALVAARISAVRDVS
ncbi:MAG: MFS transporter, partial [Actinobacteria bacterium]|nr:MFS transporter [Actinomycetota bacterium]